MAAAAPRARRDRLRRQRRGRPPRRATSSSSPTTRRPPARARPRGALPRPRGPRDVHRRRRGARRARGHDACSSRSARAARRWRPSPTRRVLVVGGAPGAALPASPFEHYYAAQPAYDAGDYDRAVEIASEGLADWPDHPLIHYQLACFHARAGRLDDARRSLDIAFAGDERTREWAARTTTSRRCGGRSSARRCGMRGAYCITEGKEPRRRDRRRSSSRRADRTLGQGRTATHRSALSAVRGRPARATGLPSPR